MGRLPAAAVMPGGSERDLQNLTRNLGERSSRTGTAHYRQRLRTCPCRCLAVRVGRCASARDGCGSRRCLAVPIGLSSHMRAEGAYGQGVRLSAPAGWRDRSAARGVPAQTRIGADAGPRRSSEAHRQPGTGARAPAFSRHGANLCLADRARVAESHRAAAGCGVQAGRQAARARARASAPAAHRVRLVGQEKQCSIAK